MHNNRFRACLSVCLSVTRLLGLGGNPLSSNSSEMAWNFEDGSILNTNFFQWYT